MLCSVSDFNTQPFIDTNRNFVYQFDFILNNFIVNKIKHGLIPDYSLSELASLITKDFLLDENSSNLKISKLKATSYYLNGQIFLNKDVFDSIDIQTLIHEYSHYLCETHFRSIVDHGGEFLFVMRMLFDKYGLITIEEFNDLYTKSNLNINIYDDLIEKMILCSKSDLRCIRKQLINNNNNPVKMLVISNSVKLIIETEYHFHHFFEPIDKSDGFYIIINKCGYLYKNKFSPFSDSLFYSIRIFSPVSCLNKRTKNTKKNSKFGFSIYSSNSIKNTFVFNSKKEAIHSLNETIKTEKQNGFFVFRSTSYIRYEENISLFNKELFSRTFSN